MFKIGPAENPPQERRVEAKIRRTYGYAGFSFRHQRRLSSALWSWLMRRAARVDCAFRAFPATRQCQWCWWRFRSAIYIRFRVRYQSLGLPNNIALNWLSSEANNCQGRPRRNTGATARRPVSRRHRTSRRPKCVAHDDVRDHPRSDSFACRAQLAHTLRTYATLRAKHRPNTAR